MQYATGQRLSARPVAPVRAALALVVAALLAVSLAVAPNSLAQTDLGAGSQEATAPGPGHDAPGSGDAGPGDAGSVDDGLADVDTTDSEALRQAMLPEPTGDPFFDAVPEGLDQAVPGDVLDRRGVMPTAAPLAPVPLARADQYLVRTTEPGGAPTRATATLLVPESPWHGEGARPVLVNAIAIDALGTQCTPGYTWAHGPGPYSSLTESVPPVTDDALRAGYAVMIPDHQGPEMAYADPYVAGYSILDTIRGLGEVDPSLENSPVAMTGYSGGAIALNGAVKLIDDYAPELGDRITGAALGGTPADFDLLLDSMSGNLAVGLLTAAIFGLFRHNAEIIPLANDTAVQLATSPVKDLCLMPLAAGGITHAPIDALVVDGGLTSPELTEFISHTRMADMASGTPLYIYHGEHEFWVPALGAQTLAAEQCAMGVPVEYVEVPGEHLVAMFTGFDGAMHWLGERLDGQPATSHCG